jgi:hypothetical protein
MGIRQKTRRGREEGRERWKGIGEVGGGRWEEKGERRKEKGERG